VLTHTLFSRYPENSVIYKIHLYKFQVEFFIFINFCLHLWRKGVQHGVEKEVQCGTGDKAGAGAWRRGSKVWCGVERDGNSDGA
jgi:hypothetical protein